MMTNIQKNTQTEKSSSSLVSLSQGNFDDMANLLTNENHSSKEMWHFLRFFAR